MFLMIIEPTTLGYVSAFSPLDHKTLRVYDSEQFQPYAMAGAFVETNLSKSIIINIFCLLYLILYEYKTSDFYCVHKVLIVYP